MTATDDAPAVPPSLTADAALRERAQHIAFLNDLQMTAQAAQQRITFLEGFLAGAGVPLDTAVPEPAPPEETREQRRAREKQERRNAQRAAQAAKKDEAAAAAEAEAKRLKRSEAAKKSAETRRKNAAAQG